LLLTRKEQNLVFLVVKLKSSFQKFYCCHDDLVNHIYIHVSQMTTVMFHSSNYNPVLSLFMTSH
jgi:hypothetical protein